MPISEGVSVASTFESLAHKAAGGGGRPTPRSVKGAGRLPSSIGHVGAVERVKVTAEKARAALLPAEAVRRRRCYLPRLALPQFLRHVIEMGHAHAHPPALAQVDAGQRRRAGLQIGKCALLPSQREVAIP